MLTAYLVGLGVWWFLMFVEVAIGKSSVARFALQGGLGFVWPLYVVAAVVFLLCLAVKGGDDDKA